MELPASRLEELAADLRRRFPETLRQVVFFGSQVRGEATGESDYDCLLVFGEVTPTIEATLERLTGEYLLHQGLVLSCIPVSTAQLEQLRFEPFVLNAQKEGLVL